MVRLGRYPPCPWKAARGDETAALGADEQRVVRELSGALLKGHGLKLVSESGLYKLIMSSKKPEAWALQEWVTREVLPAIRKTGGYVLQGVDRATVGEDAGNMSGTIRHCPCEPREISR